MCSKKRFSDTCILKRRSNIDLEIYDVHFFAYKWLPLVTQADQIQAYVSNYHAYGLEKKKIYLKRRYVYVAYILENELNLKKISEIVFRNVRKVWRIIVV